MIENNVVGSYPRLGGQARRSKEWDFSQESPRRMKSKAEGMRRAQGSSALHRVLGPGQTDEGEWQVLMGHGS